MKRLPLPALAALALAAASCTESLEKRCPSNSVPAGNFKLTLALQQTPDLCRQVRYSDGGPADASVAPQGQERNSTLCAGLEDGGPTIYLAVEGSQGIRRSPLDPDGGFSFSASALQVPQSVCNCPVDINEVMAGNLVAPADAGFSVSPDGGLSPLPASLTGTVVDSMTSDAGNCLCNVPCGLHYTLTGAPN